MKTNKPTEQKQRSNNKETVMRRNLRLKIKERKRLNNEAAKRYRTKQKLIETVKQTPYKNRMDKSRALKSLKKSLPTTPGRRITLLKTYLQKNSPTVKTLEKLKIVRSPEEMEIDEAKDSAINDLKSMLDHSKMQRSSEAVSSRQLIFASVSGESIEDKKQKKTLAKVLGVKRRTLTAGSRLRAHIMKSESSSWRLTLKKNRNNNIPDAHKRVAYDFWLNSGNSRPTGNKKDVKRERLDTRVYVSHMSHVLEKSQTDIYYDFCKENPDIKMSQRTFERLKPFFVRPVKSADRNTCLCRYHVEIKTVFQCCMRERTKILRSENDEELAIQYPVYQNINDAIASTLCEQEGDGIKKIQCLKRDCQECGVRKFELLDDEQGEELVEWEKFEYVTISCNARQERKKLMLVKKTTPIKELFKYFLDLLASFPAHQFRATWQRDQLKYITTRLPQNECVVIHDFSENYR